jgi:hypothetical protein
MDNVVRSLFDARGASASLRESIRMRTVGDPPASVGKRCTPLSGNFKLVILAMAR